MDPLAGAHDRKSGRPGKTNLIDRQQLPRASEALDTPFEAIGEDVVGQAVLGSERGGVEPAQILSVAGADLPEPADVLRADVVRQHAVVLARPALARGEGIGGRDLALARLDEAGQ